LEKKVLIKMLSTNSNNPIKDLFGFFAGLKNKEYPEFLYKNKRACRLTDRRECTNPGGNAP